MLLTNGTWLAKAWRVRLSLLAVLICLLVGCEKVGSTDEKNAVPKDAVRLLFTYSSEKEDWVKEVTATFNQGGYKTKAGKPIYVDAIAEGSGECIDEIINDNQKADVVSPASEAFVRLGNTEGRAKLGREVIGPTQNLVLSPVVIGVWEPMAKALGWPDKPIGWSDILALATDKQGWATYGHPEWGKFKFGHTHPEYSNSGLVSLFAIAYAAAGKTTSLEINDLIDPKIGEFIKGIENSVLHYGSSTGFFAKKMFANGPHYLSGAVMYENLVTQSYSQANMAFPVVAVYPKEGTFWSDHPAGIVDREWVTPERRDAAEIYIKFLLDRPQQLTALKYGFRPGSLDIPVGPPIDTAHGVDPRQPKTVLELPNTATVAAIRNLWLKNKRHARVTLVFDVSGNMNERNKIAWARDGALDLISFMSDDDSFSIMPFNNRILRDEEPQPLGDYRPAAEQILSSLFANGGASLYDTLSLAYQHVQHQQEEDPSRIAAIVVLSDGKDTTSKLTLDQLLAQIRYDFDRHTVRVFTIGYEAEDGTDVLKQISEVTQGRYYEGKQTNIREIFKDISTFF
ncbi:MAG: VWA domain-containing protein [Verrucomicrobia bacterium]|nr:VWA domain-containing protein [Verrucomicrobiota bacterium]MBV8274756.1 VWA domain-containing protein [Verrucomicrobiota bacterium]